MRHISNWMIAATLFCGVFTLTSCYLDGRDNPVDETLQEEIWNREEILSHVKDDAKVLADNMNPEMLNITNQVFSQLMTLMAKDRNYMRNMKQILALMAANNALKSLRPIPAGSELLKQGYQMYIPVDIQTFGVQVVLDENGESRLFPCQGLEFIFPATVEGLGTTLYKVAFKAGSKWNETVAPAQIQNLKGVACVYRVPETITMTLSGLFDNTEVVTLSQTSFEIGQSQVSGQTATSLKNVGYGLPGVESTIDFKFDLLQDGKLNVGLSYTNDGQNIMTMAALMTLPETRDFMELLSNLELNGSSADVDIEILGNLKLYGLISDGERFLQTVRDLYENSQNSQASKQEFSGMVDNFNACMQFYMTCQDALKPLRFKLMPEWEGETNQVMPAIWSYEHGDFMPFSKLMAPSDMASVNSAFAFVVPPMSTNLLSNVGLFSRIMQMLPLNSAEWGI